MAAAGEEVHGEERRQDQIDNQPRDEKIKPLEGMEADRKVVTEARGREYHYCRDPADKRDVAEQSRGSGRDAVDVGASVDRWNWLPHAAGCAVNVLIFYVRSAAAAVGHFDLLSIVTYVRRNTRVPL